MTYHIGVLIAGAGLAGLSCAWRIARSGRGVIVFDRGEPAREASWAGAGMLAPAGEFDRDSPALRMALRSLALYPEFIAELEAASGVSIDYRRCGAWEVALSSGESDALAQRAERRRELGMPSETGVWRGRPARYYPGDACVDPRQIGQALLAACRNLGVDIRAHEPVIEIARDGSGLRTTIGEYRDSGVLIAAGAWSGALFPGLRATKPVRGHLAAWRMPPGFLGPILRHNGTYLLQRSSGLLIAGSTTEDAGFDRTLDESALADVERRACELMPELRGIEPVERWNGLRPGIEGEGPQIGRLPGTRILTAFGHYRNGILLTPETARIIAEEAEALN